MKTLKILVLFCIILGFTTNTVNAQVTHVREVGSSPVENYYFDCLGIHLNGEVVWENLWTFGPNNEYGDFFGPRGYPADFNVLSKTEVTLYGTDNKVYTCHQVWNERRNVNKRNFVYRMSTAWQLRCEGKVVGIFYWAWHTTFPANNEPWDFSVVIDRFQIDCK